MIPRRPSRSRSGDLRHRRLTPGPIRVGWLRLTGADAIGHAALTHTVLLALALSPAHAQQSPGPGEDPFASADTAVPLGSYSIEDRLRLAIRATPRDASLYGQLAELMLDGGRHAEAHAAYSEAVRLDPSRPEYRYGLASAALSLGQHAEAETHFAWGAQLDPADPAMQLGLGEATLARGHPELAASHFRRAIELSDSAPAVRAEAGALLLRATQASRQSFPGAVRRALFYAALTIMSVAGLTLAVPVAEALLLMMVMAPLSAVRRKR